MSQHTATIEWVRGDQDFSDGRYGRGHDWHFDGGATVRASSAPSSVALPMSEAEAVDPEEALVAAMSSCHMLFFLAFAARAGFVVDRYHDPASGELGRDERGLTVMTVVTLKPAIQWSGDRVPDSEQIGDLHHRAHKACYIANSVRAEVRIEPG